MGSPRPFRWTPTGFTLLELVIVVAIIAVVGAIAVARFSGFAANSEVAATQKIVHSIQNAIDEHHAYTSEWPNTINGSFFAGGQIPYNPMDPFERREIQYYNIGSDPTRTNPIQKRFMLTAPEDGFRPFWYHSGTGAFRARVPDLGTMAEQLALYNLINNTDMKAMDQKTGPR